MKTGDEEDECKMNESEILSKIVSDIKLRPGMSAGEVVSAMYDCGGFTAKKTAQGVNILENMFRKSKEKKCTNFLAFPACIIATGLRGVICDIVKNGWVDAVITTCGTLDHDIARVWKDYYHGSFHADDAKLHHQGINRLGNIFIPNDSYGVILEKKMQPIISEIYESGVRDISGRDIIWKFGEKLAGEKNCEDSIIYQAYKNKIPVFVPGITDGAFGSQIWMFWQDSHRDFNINIMKDEQHLSDIIFNAEKTGALVIGGGISKHHTIWWNQFRGGLDYAVYITTAPEWDGSLSGARVREAVSWGKVSESARSVTIEGDATAILPLMIGAVMDRM